MNFTLVFLAPPSSTSIPEKSAGLERQDSKEELVMLPQRLSLSLSSKNVTLVLLVKTLEMHVRPRRSFQLPLYHGYIQIDDCFLQKLSGKQYIRSFPLCSINLAPPTVFIYFHGCLSSLPPSWVSSKNRLSKTHKDPVLEATSITGSIVEPGAQQENGWNGG